MRISDYIKPQDAKEFCTKCNDICSHHCVIYRKASMAYNANETKKEELKK